MFEGRVCVRGECVWGESLCEGRVTERGEGVGGVR